MQDITSMVVSVADACLGGLQGRSAVLVGADEHLFPYYQLLRQARMKNIFQEENAERLPMLLPLAQLVISAPPDAWHMSQRPTPWITAARVAQGCTGRRGPLVILDLAPIPSVEEMAGLLPAVCLYTPEDIRRILQKVKSKAS